MGWVVLLHYVQVSLSRNLSHFVMYKELEDWQRVI